MTTYRNEVRGSLPDGEQYSWSIHTSNTTTGSLAAASSAFETFFNDIWTGGDGAVAIAPNFPATVTVDELVTTQLNDATGKNVAQITVQLAELGTGVGDGLPQEVAVCVSLRTDLPTRAGRGRFFLPMTLLTTCIGSRLDPGVSSAFASSIAHGMTTLVTAGYIPVIYHRVSRAVTPIISVDCGDVFDAMRSRRDKLRENRTTRFI
jgi:hypothetical protein